MVSVFKLYDANILNNIYILKLIEILNIQTVLSYNVYTRNNNFSCFN